MHTTTPPPLEMDGSGLGEPFDQQKKLLFAWDDADKALKSAQASGDREAILRAALNVTDRLADLEAYQRNLASGVLLSLKFAMKYSPDLVSALLSEVPVVTRLAEAIAAIELKGVC